MTNMWRVTLIIFVAFFFGATAPTYATGLCTQPVPLWITDRMKQAGEDHALLQQHMIEMQKATDLYCREYQITPTADSNQEIGLGCTLYSGVLYGERVYWSLCSKNSAQAAIPVPDPNTITWDFQNQNPYIIELEFYSQHRDNVWPGNGQVFVLTDRDTHKYPLACIPGEIICFGAWLQGNPQGTYWGAGWGRQQYCAACCHVCGPEVPLFVFGP